MKIVDAVWEKRNLGVSCAEIETTKSDSVEEIIKDIKLLSEQYQVIKVPAGRVDLLFALLDNGFRYIESLIETGKSFKKEPEIPEKYCKIGNRVRRHIASPEEIEEVLSLVRSGDIFATDRIALDPAFGRKKAGERYAYWIQDLMATGSFMSVSELNGQKTGFTVGQLRNEGKEFHSVFGGVFPNSNAEGYAVIGMHYTVKWAYETGAKRFVSHVSSNNLPMLKIHLDAGLKIKSVSYVLIRHVYKDK